MLSVAEATDALCAEELRLMSIIDTTRDRIFRKIHSSNLVYNACWEDPRIDRQLMQIDGNSKIVMITSAGCNALDYLLDQPAEIHTVDVNPRQNALLQFKLRLIERGDFDDLFGFFGHGAHRDYRKLYKLVRHKLPEYAQAFWDVKIKYFDVSGLKKSFYYRGSSGAFAWAMRQFLNANKGFRHHVYDFIDAQNLDEQRELYAKIEPHLWNKLNRWLLRRDVVLAMVGVPRPQRELIDRQHPESLPGYVRDNLRRVCTELPIRDNYFWRVYLKGHYSHQCCPNYLKLEFFEQLNASIERIQTHTMTIADFLRQNPGQYSHFVLLDHQDWLAWHRPDALREEWRLILANSRPGSKILLRSASTQINFLPDFAREALRPLPELSQPLHLQDRVGTYGSTLFAEVV